MMTQMTLMTRATLCLRLPSTGADPVGALSCPSPNMLTTRATLCLVLALTLLLSVSRRPGDLVLKLSWGQTESLSRGGNLRVQINQSLSRSLFTTGLPLMLATSPLYLFFIPPGHDPVPTPDTGLPLSSRITAKECLDKVDAEYPVSIADKNVLLFQNTLAELVRRLFSIARDPDDDAFDSLLRVTPVERIFPPSVLRYMRHPSRDPITYTDRMLASMPRKVQQVLGKLDTLQVQDLLDLPPILDCD
ncbi:hypothetical protein PG996_010119 [Apiospora saccharicola]|uniref:Uncharacterized protein n=1 Tax=Apiospora saccharicola TaxID=335842 RepID=A0ABR1UMQ4_9PEZI